MAESQRSLPIRLDVFEADGTRVASRFVGNLPRDHAVALDIDAEVPEGALLRGGHAELVYDFSDGGEADGWLHTLVRAEHRASGHIAESSFGAHIYNTAMTYRDEPQSYSGPPPGLSTRLFLKLGHGGRRSFAHLIYSASSPWLPQSSTTLLLHDANGAVQAEAALAIACSGSAHGGARGGVRRGRGVCGGGGRLRPDPRRDVPAVRVSRGSGRAGRVQSGPHVRVLRSVEQRAYPDRMRSTSVFTSGEPGRVQGRSENHEVAQRA